LKQTAILFQEQLWKKIPEFAIAIAKRGWTHDLTKFDNLEFQNLWKGEKNFDIAIDYHTNNQHHPEHFPNGIYGMSDLDLAEMVADSTAHVHKSLVMIFVFGFLMMIKHLKSMAISVIKLFMIS
jgi:hypothetical protein